jgi:hypothetical protein
LTRGGRLVTRSWLLLALGVAIILALLWYFLRPGFRGAIGCRNEYQREVALTRVSGFSRVVQCPTLKPGEHSFSYIGRQDVPAEVSIVWRLAGESEERHATVPLRDVPRNAPGEAALFFVLGKDVVWRAEYSPRLSFDSLGGNN